MIRTVGVSGYFSTGSSAVVDLLHEFDETQVLNSEFYIARGIPDGLEDLENSLRGPHSSAVAIKRFRKIMKEPLMRKSITKEEMNKIVDEFLNSIIGYSWLNNAPNMIIDIYQFPLSVRYLRYMLWTICLKLRLKFLCKSIQVFFNYKVDYSVLPENFDEASKLFIINILAAMGIDWHHEEKKIIVINQAFLPSDPIRSFKYFENPASIIVDRDPRDHYLFTKYFLRPQGICFPSNNVNDYIKYFLLQRRSSQNLRSRTDVFFVNFEELVYDSENATKKVANFLGITKHIRKGECFKPTHSRNNTQLFKKYTGCESDLKKIEQELQEYLFPFENYPDIDPEGEMFFGSQLNKKGSKYR